MGLQKYRADKATNQADGIAIPERTKPRACVHSVDNPYRMTRRHSWRGTIEVPASEPRVQAVEWGHDEDVYNIRKDGRRGAWLYKQFVCDLRIEIPHWDFWHPPAVEETVDD